jgi:hypothetical protein
VRGFIVEIPYDRESRRTRWKRCLTSGLVLAEGIDNDENDEGNEDGLRDVLFHHKIQD